MAFTERKFFYELLVRGTVDGIGGAHAVYLEQTLKDGVVIAEKVGDAIPVALAKGDPGIPLADVLGDINTAALVTIEAKDAQIAALTSEKQAALGAQKQAEGERDAARGQVLELQAKLAAMQPVVDGVPQLIKKWQLWAGLRMDDPSLTAYKGVKAYTESFTGMKRDLWLDSTGIERSAPALEAFKVAFKKSDADIDDMFTRYAAITAVQAAALD